MKWAPLPNNGALPVDIDATILIAHSDKENPTQHTNGHLGTHRCWPISTTAKAVPANRCASRNAVSPP